jgi:WhiB family transcriptional regulator, redox-sensing transcriptional regulator
MGRWNWRAAARCRAIDAEGLFLSGAQQREARQFCRTCAVRTECLAHALDHRVEFGVWGGMTERERRALLRTRPDVSSWTDLLAAARTAHYTSTSTPTAAQAPGALPEVAERIPTQRGARDSAQQSARHPETPPSTV